MGKHWDVLKAAISEQRAEKKHNLNTNERQFQAASIEILETPASPLGRTIAAVIILFVLLALAWSWIGRIDVNATLPGKIVPVGQIKVIEPQITGSILAIHVQNGMKVKQGELLIELDPTEQTAERTKTQKDLMVSRLISARLEAMLLHAGSDVPADEIVFAPPENADAFMVDLQREVLVQSVIAFRAGGARIDAEIDQREKEVERYTASIRERNALLELAKQRRDIFENLTKKGLGARSRYLDAAQIVQDQMVSLTNERGQIEEIQAAIDALQARLVEMQETFFRDTVTELADNERRVAALQEELIKAKLQEARARLESPVAGTVQQLSVHTIGEVAPAGQMLMAIVPQGTRLEIQARLANKDKGFVVEGQIVRIKLEAFPFTKYGTLSGEVVSISNDAVPQSQALAAARQGAQAPAQQANEPLVFPVRISLNEQVIRINGADVVLTPGMSVTAEVKTGQRRVIEFMLDPLLKFRDEALRER